MKLKEYFDKNRIDPVTFSYENKISLTSLYRYMRGERANFKIACRIETATNKEVSVEELRSKDV